MRTRVIGFWFLMVAALVIMTVTAFTQTVTNALPVSAGSSPAFQINGLQFAIPFVVPVLVAGLKGLLPNVPARWLPLLAIVIGAGGDLLMSLVGLTSASNPGLAALLGAAGIGIREFKDQTFKPVGPQGNGGSAGVGAGTLLVLVLGVGVLAGCAHFDVTQTFVDPETKTVFTNRARATLFCSKEVMKRVDIAVHTKSSTKLIGASGWESTGDPDTVKAIGGAIGEAAGSAAAAALKKSIGIP